MHSHTIMYYVLLKSQHTARACALPRRVADRSQKQSPAPTATARSQQKAHGGAPPMPPGASHPNKQLGRHSVPRHHSGIGRSRKPSIISRPQFCQFMYPGAKRQYTVYDCGGCSLSAQTARSASASMPRDKPGSGSQMLAEEGHRGPGRVPSVEHQADSYRCLLPYRCSLPSAIFATI